MPFLLDSYGTILNIQVEDLEKFINKNAFPSLEISNDNCLTMRC